MSLKHAVLGFLYKEPLSGYDLSKMFDGSRTSFWTATHTQIYKTLNELNEDGMVFCQVVQQEQSPNKKIYHITEKGRDELNKWLKADQDVTQIRDKFLLQLSFINILSEQEIVEVIENRIKKIKKKIDSLRCGEYYKGLKYAKNERERLLMYTALEYGVGFYEFELQWLKKCREKLENVIRISEKNEITEQES
jgi:DNA-binding PadR family transcriptional regulator